MRLKEWLDKQGRGAKTAMSRGVPMGYSTVDDLYKGKREPGLELAKRMIEYMHRVAPKISVSIEDLCASLKDLRRPRSRSKAAATSRTKAKHKKAA